MSGKVCIRCGTHKPIGEYYSHPQMADGHLTVCKACVLARVNARRAKKIQEIRQYDRERGLLPHRKQAVKERAPRYADRKSAAKWRKANPNKATAHSAVEHALRIGTLIRATECERCGADWQLDAHHENYAKPLEVVWLCKECHGARHREINEERRAQKDAA